MLYLLHKLCYVTLRHISDEAFHKHSHFTKCKVENVILYMTQKMSGYINGEVPP